MKCIKPLSTFLTLATFTSCVTTHHYSPIKSLKQSLAVSCSKPTWLTDQFASVSCTFENTSKEWIEVQAKDIKIKAIEEMKFLNPKETNDFLAAYRYQEEKENYNTNMALTGLLIASTAVVLSSSDANVRGAAGAVGAGAIGYGVGRDINKYHQETQAPMFGENHILGPTVRVPAELFVRRSFILESKQKEHKVDSLEICMVKPEEECLKLDYPILRP